METIGEVEPSESEQDTQDTEGMDKRELQKFWQEEMKGSDRRLRKFLRQGGEVVNRYLDKRANEDGGSLSNGPLSSSRLNLFHSNISTLQSMLYGSTPNVEVSREHADPDDDVARVASVLFKRILDADTDQSGADLPTVLKAALQDRLLPGSGWARVMYNTRFEEQEGYVFNEETQTMEMGVEEKLVEETCTPVYVHWQDVRWGWCRIWAEMPWLAFRTYLDKAEATERFGEKKADKLSYKHQTPIDGTGLGQTDSDETDTENQKAEIWEIWKKNGREVHWYSKSLDEILDKKDDPLELEGFWPCPMPMMANITTMLLQPRSDFVIAQDLYNEIDELTSRIRVITRAVKVVGVYDKNADASVGRMLQEGQENELIPVDNWAMFAEKGGLAGVIDWFPVQEVVETLKTLRSVLSETVGQLYQLTGMNDIMSGGNTEQYTGEGTQQLKAKFGSIRVQALQDEFARFASDLEALKAQVIAKHFDAATIVEQSNAEFLPDGDKDKIGPALQLMQSDDSKWRIQIRPESIAMIDYAQLKSERTEFLTAMATFLQSSQAVIKQVPNSTPILLEMLKWGMAGFKGANYLEGIMDRAIDEAMKAVQNPQPKEDPAKAAAEAAHGFEMQKIQAKAQADVAVIKQKGQAAMQEEQQDHQNKMSLMQEEFQRDMKLMMEQFNRDVTLVRENLSADIQTEQAQSAYAIEEEVIQHENKMEEIETSGEISARQQDGKTNTD